MADCLHGIWAAGLALNMCMSRLVDTISCTCLPTSHSMPHSSEPYLNNIESFWTVDQFSGHISIHDQYSIPNSLVGDRSTHFSTDDPSDVSSMPSLMTTRSPSPSNEENEANVRRTVVVVYIFKCSCSGLIQSFSLDDDDDDGQSPAVSILLTTTSSMSPIQLTTITTNFSTKTDPGYIVIWLFGIYNPLPLRGRLFKEATLNNARTVEITSPLAIF